MKRTITFLILITSSLILLSQNDSIIGGSGPVIDQAYLNSLEDIPIWNCNSTYPIQSFADNSQRIYFPEIRRQIQNECGQVSGVYYTFAYELNYINNKDATSKDNMYPTHFTYNFLNHGNASNGSTIESGWEILKQSGCPSVTNYGSIDAFGDATKWKTGFDFYETALHNRVDEQYVIELDDPDAALECLKRWLYNHDTNIADEPGGLVCFLTNQQGFQITQVPEGPNMGKSIVKNFSNPYGITHYMTIVGYDDEIPVEFLNNDDEYTNDQDINGDGNIDIDDMEKGAFILANSRGNLWPTENDGGFIYWPYKHLKSSSAMLTGKVHIMTVKNEYKPGLLLQTSISHPNRDVIKIGVDYNEKTTSEFPGITDPAQNYYRAFYFGGDFPFLGENSGETIDLTLDYSYFYEDIDVGVVLLDIFHDENYVASGKINGLKLIDKRWGETFELTSDVNEVNLINGHNWFGINYDLLVPGDDQIIDAVKIINSDMVSRFNPIVTGNGNLVISGAENDNDRVNIDMYNSTIFIDEGCQLNLGDRVKFTAKRGENYIVINGNLSYKEGYKIAEYLDFEAEVGSSLEIHLNGDQVIEISNAGFKNITIKSKLPDIKFTDCVFENSILNQQKYNLSVDACSFTFSSIVAKNPSSQPILINNNVAIKNSTFSSPNENANSILEIYGYENFMVDNNEFNCILYNQPELYNNGIVINYSGSTGGENIISNNIIKNAANSIFGMSGIQLYSSNAIVTMNDIHDNSIGLSSLNNSQVEVVGNKLASIEAETQQINNNLDYQLFASADAFPEAFIWNSVYGGLLDGDCYVMHDIELPIMVLNENIAWNYWGGEENFDKDVNLCPPNHYDYAPIWQLSSSDPEYSDAQLLYQEGQSYIIDSSYNLAKLTFKQLVNTYPMHSQAKQSMKELLYLEPLCNNNFEVLKNWYLTDLTINDYPELKELGKELASKCDEKLENFQSAIEWYESIIQSPPSLEDSIFAIIDLEHLYWAMGIDTTLRTSTYIGKLSQYIPKSFSKLRDERDMLLSLLHNKQNSTETEINNEDNKKFTVFDEINSMFNLPNPCTKTTTIYFKINNSDEYYLKLLNLNGENIKNINIGYLSDGNHNIKLELPDLQPGMYYYSLNNSRGYVAGNKMIITN